MGPVVARSHARLPAVDENLLAEGSRAEIVDGELLLTPPAEEPHGTQHFDLAYVLGAHVAPGYRGAVDLLTRAAEDQDFAPDASIFPAARDPETGGRQLDELSFEVVGRQPLSVCTRKARALVARGIRRVFCVVVERRQVLEWSVASDGWDELAADATVVDRCLTTAMPVAALLDAANADRAVIAALAARDSAAVREIREEGRVEGRLEGRLEGRRAAVRDLCEVLRVPIDPAREAALAAMDAGEVDRVIDGLKHDATWPS